MNLKNVRARARVSRLNKQTKEQNIQENFLNKNLEKFLNKILTLIAHFELAKDSRFNIYLICSQLSIFSQSSWDE